MLLSGVAEGWLLCEPIAEGLLSGVVGVVEGWPLTLPLWLEVLLCAEGVVSVAAPVEGLLCDAVLEPMAPVSLLGCCVVVVVVVVVAEPVCCDMLEVEDDGLVCEALAPTEDWSGLVLDGLALGLVVAAAEPLTPPAGDALCEDSVADGEVELLVEDWADSVDEGRVELGLALLWSQGGLAQVGVVDELGVLLGEADGLAAGCCVPAGGASLEAPASPVTALQGGLAQPVWLSLGCVWLGEVEVVLGLVPALPEMAPLWPDSVLAPLEVDAAEPLTPPSVEALEALAAGATLSFSFTPFTPSTDLASFLASFLSSFEGTEPVSSTLPLSTEI